MYISEAIIKYFKILIERSAIFTDKKSRITRI